jgi:hypothetical protein
MIDKAVYSFWTKPMGDTYVGFNSEKSLIECISISVMMSKNYFSKVELVTDIRGKELLIDKYNIPFTSVSIELEEALKDIDQKHWAIGKIYACKIQKEPFMHIDNDVIWFKKPPHELLIADACFQNGEGDEFTHTYDYLIKHAQDNYIDCPNYIKWDNMYAYNCGIIGFNRLEHLETWWQVALEYIDYIDSYFGKEYDTWNQITSLIFEQFYIVSICDKFNYDVKLITKDFVDDSTSKLLGYTHLLSSSKRSEYVEKLISNKYKILFPKKPII